MVRLHFIFIKLSWYDYTLFLSAWVGTTTLYFISLSWYDYTLFLSAWVGTTTLYFYQLELVRLHFIFISLSWYDYTLFLSAWVGTTKLYFYQLELVRLHFIFISLSWYDYTLFLSAWVGTTTLYFYQLELVRLYTLFFSTRKDMIDDALLRPGRLEIHMEISLPNEKVVQCFPNLKIQTAVGNKNTLAFFFFLGSCGDSKHSYSHYEKEWPLSTRR